MRRHCDSMVLNPCSSRRNPWRTPLICLIRCLASWPTCEVVRTFATAHLGVDDVGREAPRPLCLGAWAPSVVGRAQEAQRLVRRLRRWLDHNRRKAPPLFWPLDRARCGARDGQAGLCGLGYLEVVEDFRSHPFVPELRGRAVPLGWRCERACSAAVALETYKALLEEGQSHLPWACKAVLLADRGGAATPWMSHLRQLGWHFRLRIKAKFWMHPSHLASFQGVKSRCSRVQVLLARVSMTDKHFGLVPSRWARPLGKREYW